MPRLVHTAERIVRLFRLGHHGGFQALDGEGRGAPIVWVAKRIGRLRLLLACLFGGGAARGALFQDDALALFRDGIRVAGAGGEAVEDVVFALFDLAAFVVCFFSGRVAAEARLLFFEGLARFEGCVFLGLKGGVAGDGGGVAGGVGGEGGFGGGDVDAVEEAEG